MSVDLTCGTHFDRLNRILASPAATPLSQALRSPACVIACCTPGGIILGPAGTGTSSNSSVPTARIVYESAGLLDCHYRLPLSKNRMGEEGTRGGHVQTATAKPRIARPVTAFLTRYGRRARISAAACRYSLS